MIWTCPVCGYTLSSFSSYVTREEFVALTTRHLAGHLQAMP